MPNAQLNYANLAVRLVLVMALFFIGKPALSQGISSRNKPDPILTAPQDGPCDPALAQPDVTAGTDVQGHQLAAADLQTGPIPVPGQVMVPLKTKRGPAYVMADGKKLDPLLNPKPACK